MFLKLRRADRYYGNAISPQAQPGSVLHLSMEDQQAVCGFLRHLAMAQIEGALDIHGPQTAGCVDLAP